MKNNCRWVLANGQYCEKSVNWRMVPDGGEPGASLVRKYEPFCPFHSAKNKKNEEEE